MKKILLLMFLLVTFLVVQVPSAFSFPMSVGDTIKLTSYNPDTSAGVMRFLVNGSSSYSTFCIDKNADTYQSVNYTVDTVVALGKTFNQRALGWLFMHGRKLSISGETSKFTYLQHAIWSYFGQSSPTAPVVSNYIAQATAAVVNGWTNNGRVATVNYSNSDPKYGSGQPILVAIPEPAVMVLLGTAFLTIGVFSRKKFKK